LEHFGNSPYQPQTFEHLEGCLQSTNPEYILQEEDSLARSIYWRRCDGRYLNLCMEELNEQLLPDGKENSERIEERLTSMGDGLTAELKATVESLKLMKARLELVQVRLKSMRDLESE
jgi:hypothetical protein